jgi:hypothetical protein
MKTSATNRRLRTLLTGIKGGSLIPRPEFQRRLVWANKHKLEFVRTVLMEYPFPEIYIAAGEVDPDTGEGTEMLVDGQQRMTALYQYFSGSQDLRLGDVKAYADLTDEEKLAFLEYEVVVRDLGKKSIEEIKSVFTRINSTRYALNAMEIQNARYDGAFKQFGESLLEHAFFETHQIFTTADMRRMGDLLFCLTVVATINSAYFNRDDDIEEFLRKYNDEFPLAEDTQQRLNRVFEFISECRLPPNCRAWKKADALTLIVELDRALTRSGCDLAPDAVGSRLADFYVAVENAASGTGEDRRAERYYKAALQASNDRSSRITRGQVLAEIITGVPPAQPA